MTRTPRAKKDSSTVTVPKLGPSRRDEIYESDEIIEEVARAGGFAIAGVAPTIRPCEVIVSYSDVRDFTKYCNDLKGRSMDRLVENFLHSFYRIFPLAVHRAQSDVDKVRKRALVKSPRRKVSVDDRLRTTAHLPAVQKLLVPATYKTLGDGMMMVWELDGAGDRITKGLTAEWICHVVDTVHEVYEHQFTAPTDVEVDAFTELAQTHCLGSGVARGNALRLDFRGQLQPDYAGPPMNLGARLANLARPSGIVIALDVERSHLQKAASRKAGGTITKLSGIKGFDNSEVEAWFGRGAIPPG